LTVCERILRDFKYNLPGSGVTQFTVTPDLMESPAQELERLMATGEKEKAKALGEAARQFALRFSQMHGVGIRFTPEAVERLVEMALAEGVLMQDVCERTFKDYQFGLKLIQKNTGQDDFLLDREAVVAPDATL